jgi:predicted acyltransferase
VGSSAAGVLPSPIDPAAASGRLAALDAFRGMTIAAMMVVNTPGDWDHAYPQLLHAEWHGWTLTDTIFPFFLFIVGVSMAFSFSKRKAEGGLLWHTLRRSTIIFGIGLALNVLSFFLFHRQHVRIPGVLQRIGVCFFFAALIYLVVGPRSLLPTAALLLAGYWALMTFVPVPGYGAGRLDLDGNLARSVDVAVLGAHTWKHDPNWDPEGPLSTIPAIATTLLGVAAGELLRSRRAWAAKLSGLMAGGAVAISLGLLWGTSFPINKNLWTSSYALLMAGLAAVVLALCLWVIDGRGWKGWAAPFFWLGTNAIALFVLSTLATLFLIAIKLPTADGKRRSLYGAIYATAFRHFDDARLGSLLFALAFLAVWIAVGALMYRRRIFVRI